MTNPLDDVFNVKQEPDVWVPVYQIKTISGAIEQFWATQQDLDKARDELEAYTVKGNTATWHYSHYWSPTVYCYKKPDKQSKKVGLALAKKGKFFVSCFFTDKGEALEVAVDYIKKELALQEERLRKATKRVDTLRENCNNHIVDQIL